LGWHERFRLIGNVLDAFILPYGGLPSNWLHSWQPIISTRKLGCLNHWMVWNLMNLARIDWSK
jgi:hypothetical protein